MKVVVFDVWHFQLLVGVFLFTLIAVVRMRGPWQLKFPFVFFLAYSVLFGVWLSSEPLTPEDFVLKMLSLKTFAVLILLWLVMRERHLLTTLVIFRVIFTALVLDCFWLWLGGAGLFEGNTQDTLVMAILLPLMLGDRFYRWATPILIYTIVVTRGGASYLVLAAHMLIWSWHYFKPRDKFIIFVGIAGLLYGLVSGDVINGDRFEKVWSDHLLYWADQKKVVWGFGPGSYEWVSYKLRAQVGFEQYWLHSDWLQFAFEVGLIGLLLALMAYGYAALKLRRNLPYFATWLGLGIGMTFYSPIQFFSVQIIAAFLLAEAAREFE